MAFVGDEFIFTWKIENFSCLPYREGDKIESAPFTVESVKKSKWRLWLYPRGEDDGQGKDHISLFLLNLEHKPLTILYYLGLDTADGEFEAQKLTKCTKDTYATEAFGSILISLASLYKNKHLYLPQDVLTVKCCIRPCNEKHPMPNNALRRQCSSITRIQVQRRSQLWPIKNISRLCKNRKKTSICLDGDLKNAPSLKLVFSVNKNSNEEHAVIEILQTNPGKRLYVQCKIKILTADKDYQDSAVGTHLFSSQLDNEWIFPLFIKIKNLTDDKYLFVDNTLILQCDFALTNPGTEYHVEAPQYTPLRFELNKPSNVNKLGGSICKLYTRGEFCDVTLRADGKSFPAHKFVLCARSPIFTAMFESDMKEKDTNVVNIADIDAKTLERFLKFLHSDIVDEEMTPEEASNLYKAADKYQVDLLKQKCSILIMSTLSVSSVCEVIVLADTHQDHFLMSCVDNFLQYHFNETFHSKYWKDFMDSYPKLSGTIMLKALKNKSL